MVAEVEVWVDDTQVALVIGTKIRWEALAR